MKKLQKSAFSLIELSIVVLVIAILVTGAISVSTVALNNAKVKVTKERMDAVYKAIGAYVAINHRLPCPASMKVTKSSANYGVEQGGGASCAASDGIYSSNTVSTIYYGMLPVSTLGLADDMAEDGFGTRFSYVMLEKLAQKDSDDDSGATIGFGFSTDTGVSAIKIYQLPSTNEVDDVAMAIISHGANKYGGFNAYSAMQNSTSGANAHEVYNAVASVTENVSPVADTANYGINSSFVGYVTLTASNADNDVFDDMVLFKRRIDIVRDFDLGFLLPCTSGTTGYDGSAAVGNAFAGQLKYDSSNCTTPSDERASQRCGPFASQWIDSTGCIAY